MLTPALLALLGIAGVALVWSEWRAARLERERDEWKADCAYWRRSGVSPRWAGAAVDSEP